MTIAAYSKLHFTAYLILYHKRLHYLIITSTIISISVYPKAINENEDTEENRKKLQNLNNTRNLGGRSSCKKNENSANEDYSTTPSVDFQISKSRNTRWSRR